MRLSHADFRPGKRPRFVPSGPPRRKLPLIRIVLLIGLGIFVYTRFDSMWASVRTVVDPGTIWHKITGSSGENRDGLIKLTWSGDSSRVALECPRGLDAVCCETLGRADDDLCGEAAALLGKAHWRGAVQGAGAAKQPIRLEGRAVVSDLGDWGFELSDVRGRDAAGGFLYRRAAGSHAWCDTRRGCLKSLIPRAPLFEGRMTTSAEAGGAGAAGTGDAATTVWVSGSPRVRAVLPGRIVAVDEVVGMQVAKDSENGETSNNGKSSTVDLRKRGSQANVSIRVYHGGERYVTYGPLRPAQGVKPGVMVKTGSHLGDAMMSSGAGRYALTVRLRDGGRPADPESFWGIRAAPATPVTPSSPDDLLYSGVP